MCDLIEEVDPGVVSFHFGLPDKNLLHRARRTSAKILSTATSVHEARWLEDQGCDANIAQGFEAGGHRGMFLTDDVSMQVGTMALVPRVVDAVSVPVIAAGGIAVREAFWRLSLSVRRRRKLDRHAYIVLKLRSVHFIVKS
jgi:nitronate monooxygenase